MSRRVIYFRIPFTVLFLCKRDGLFNLCFKKFDHYYERYYWKCLWPEINEDN